MGLCLVSFLLPYMSALYFLLGFLMTRTSQSFLRGVGQVLVEVICQTLKHLHFQPRPKGAQRRDSGFPSSHTAWMAYTCVALAQGGSVPRFLVLMTLVLITGAGRVVSREHYIHQVCGGALTGGILGLLWSTLGRVII